MKDLFFKTIMLKGEAGGTIASIEKTSSELNVDTYTITLNIRSHLRTDLLLLSRSLTERTLTTTSSRPER